MKKKLKKYGQTLIISFTSEERKIYGLVPGDIIEIDDKLIQKNKNRAKELKHTPKPTDQKC